MTTATAFPIQSLLVDRRQPHILQTLNVDDAPVVATELAAGSLLVTCADGTLLGIERVPADSLAQSIRRDVLKARATALRQLTPWAYVVIVGSITPLSNGNTIVNGATTGWSWLSMQGALATVQEIGVVVLTIRSDTELPALLRTLARRDRGQVKAQPQRDAIFASPGEVLLSSLPGIGEEKAEAILRASGERVALALVSLTDPRYAPAGVGPKTIAATRQALGLADGEVLAIDTVTT